MGVLGPVATPEHLGALLQKIGPMSPFIKGVGSWMSVGREKEPRSNYPKTLSSGRKPKRVSFRRGESHREGGGEKWLGGAKTVEIYQFEHI